LSWEDVTHIFETFHRGWDPSERLERIKRLLRGVEGQGMTDNAFPPVFATNVPPEPDNPGETVAEKLNLLFQTTRQQLAEPPALAIATAYLNTGGFGLIAEELEQAPRVRLLLGAEPDAGAGRRIDDTLTREELSEVVGENTGSGWPGSGT
jgi:hypothetical protein